MKTTAMPLDLIRDEAPASVAAGVSVALKRLTPEMDRRDIRADVAVRPHLLVHMSGAALVDLLEELFAVAIHHARAGRIVITAVNHGGQVNMNVTDDTVGADTDARAGSLRALTEKAALHGAELDIKVRPTEGTTMTVRLSAPPDRPGANADARGGEP